MAAQNGEGEGEGEDVYATLLLSDTYLPGALVLAHSLRDAGTTKKLAVLVTLDSVSTSVITQLRSVYDHVIPVPRIRNSQPANLQLMNRTDLHSAFTKINLWKLTQFRKIVYIDADVVAYRATDELFDIPHPFSAAPDIGWPDLFNTGVMVLTPNMGDFYAMKAMAERGISFDGADQGLINMHFRDNYNRISFTYNVTPSAHYQYLPAYRHFQSSINMVHFIGSAKPWFQGRQANTNGSPYDEMVGRWWAVYDRHYRVPSPPPEATRIGTTGELHSNSHQDYGEHYHYAPPPHHPEQHAQSHHEHPYHESQHPCDHQHHEHTDEPYHSHVVAEPGHTTTITTTQQPQSTTHVFNASSPPPPSSSNLEGTETEAREEQGPQSHRVVRPYQPEQKQHPFQPTFSNWDAQRHPPPYGSKPEAENFPSTVYEMSKDSAPFVPPERYPSPPKNMWYEVPRESRAPPAEMPKPIFPWEGHRTQPSRVFPDDNQKPKPRNLSLSTGETWYPHDAHSETSAESPVTEAPSEDQRSEPYTPLTPTIRITSSDPWTAFTRTNAWDEIPEIERYVDKHRRTRSYKSPGVIGLPSPGEGADEAAWGRRGSRLTDFPTKDERPSLPVTPAPIRRPKFWGGGGGPGLGYDGDDDGLLPAAEGVPEQTQWDPVAQLQKLARQHSEVLLEKLGGNDGASGGGSVGHVVSSLPLRSLPFGSEELVSPTHVAPTANIISPQPVKGRTALSLGAAPTLLPELDPDTTPLVIPKKPMPEGSVKAEAKEEEPVFYTDPGPALKKGEIVQPGDALSTSTKEAPLSSTLSPEGSEVKQS